MKSIKHILYIGLMVFCGTGCTKYDFIDTGIANGNHQNTMWEYFDKDPYNWDSLQVMAAHAGVRDIFEGTSEHGKDITFLGITNHSIRRYLLRNQDTYKQITDIPKEECKEIILSSILKGRIERDGFPPGKPSTSADDVIGSGGKMYTTLSGKQLWIYTYKEPYNGVPNTGAVRIYIVSPDTARKTEVASSNIMTLTGVVHSLSYGFTIKDF